MELFLKKLEETLKSYVKETFLPPHRAKTPAWTHHDLKFFIEGIDKASTAFTEARGHIPKNYLNQKEFRSAYLLYFTLINAAKVWKVLDEAQSFLKSGPLKILDLGCGPGTASLACSAVFANRPLEVTGVEQNIRALRDAKTLWEKMKPAANHKFSTKELDIRPNTLESFLRGKKFNLIIAANFLSELPFPTQQRMCETILKHTDFFILIEPALQEVTRQVMELRDHLVAEEFGFVCAPCLHQQNCPMRTANNRDWCHFYFDWKCPLLIRQIDHFVGNKHDYLKMAYMIFQSTWTKNLDLGAKNLWRVVSSPLISNGKKELILCGANGRLPKIERLDRDQSELNKDFDELKRGDILEWPGKHRITKEESITIVKKF